MGRFLITTALEETWRYDGPVLFLGEWCRLYNRRSVWQSMESVVLPYHWDNRDKLYEDYQYLKGLHERLLVDLTKQLNKIHEVDHSIRYWRILLGPWLGYFIQMVFDRWASIQQAISTFELSKTIVLTGEEKNLIPKNMADFSNLFVTDAWNHHIYASIIEQFTHISYAPQIRQGGIERVKPTLKYNLKQKLKQTLADGYSRFASMMSKERDVFFLATYLPVLDEMKLHCRFGQFPQLWRSQFPVEVSVDLAQRDWIICGDNKTEFERCIRTLIPRQIPTAYLEGYVQLVQQTENMSWPRKPQLIWTSNAFSIDDVFKAWAAQKIEQGTSLVIGQHGGSYGTSRWSFLEDHEMAISDCYFSWGWTETSLPKVKPVGQLKAKRALKMKHDVQTSLLLITTAVARQSYPLISLMTSRQWLDYFNDQCIFVEHLPPDIREALTVRLYSCDWGWGQVERWKERFPQVHLDDYRSSMKDLFRQSRICVSTSNTTTFLESMTMDIPTVIYWNPKHSELRDSAFPYFESLRQVGIFHHTAEGASRHVATVWNDVEAWWMSREVRNVLEKFRTRYCDLPMNLLDNVEVALREVISEAGLRNNNLYGRPI